MMKRIESLLVVLATLWLVSCDLFKKEEEELSAPPVSTPQVSSLSQFTGLPSTSKDTNVTLLQSVMSKVNADITSAGVLYSKAYRKNLKSTSSPDELVNRTFNNESIVPGITANGELYLVWDSTIDWGSETYEPVPGDYEEITGKYDLELTLENYSVPNLRVNGKIDDNLDMTFRETIKNENMDMEFSFTIAYGFGYGLSISNLNDYGPGGKFLLTFGYARSRTALATSENNFDFDEFFYPSPNEIVGGKLYVYDNNNAKIAEYSLSVNELALIIPTIFFPAALIPMEPVE